MRIGAPTICAISLGETPSRLVQYEDDALLVREPIEQPAERANALPALGVLVRRGLVGARDAIFRSGVRERGPALGGSAVHQDDVDRDAMQPRSELGLAAEVREALVDLDEHFLDDVFEVVASAEHSVREAGDPLAVRFVETPKGVGVSTGSPRDELCLVRHPFPYLLYPTRVLRQSDDGRARKGHESRGYHSIFVAPGMDTFKPKIGPEWGSGSNLAPCCSLPAGPSSPSCSWT